MVFQTITELDENSLNRMVTDRDEIIKQTKAELEAVKAEKAEKDAEIRRLKEALREKGICI